MPDPVADLVLDLLEWIGPDGRPYLEVMEAWRTSCPRLPVWEDATSSGFISSAADGDGCRLVTVSPAGRAHLQLARPSP